MRSDPTLEGDLRAPLPDGRQRGVVSPTVRSLPAVNWLLSGTHTERAAGSHKRCARRSKGPWTAVGVVADPLSQGLEDADSSPIGGM